MKRIVLSCLVILVIITSLGALAFSCTLSTPSITKFDEAEFIFIGQVVGYSQPLAFDYRKAADSIDPISSTAVAGRVPLGKTAGIRVRLTEKVHVPHARNEVFEIYTYDLGADCSIRGVSLSTQEKEFPIGSEVRVIAKEAVFVSPASSSGAVRLEVRPGDLSDIVLNVDSSGRRVSSAVSILDYEQYGKDLEKSESASRLLLGAFEARKDLLRLKNAKSQTERNAILDRLIPSGPQTDLDLKPVFDAYAANPSEAERYFETHLRVTSPETYQQYMVLKRVSAELERRGFSRKQVEDATRVAMAGGAAFEFESLLNASLLILKKPMEPSVLKPNDQ